MVPTAGLPLLEALAGQLDGYHLFHAAHADLLRRLERQADAVRAYERALELATNATERAYLERRLAELTGVRRKEPSPNRDGGDGGPKPGLLILTSLVRAERRLGSTVEGYDVDRMRPITWPSGSRNRPISTPSVTVSGPITRLPPRLSAFRSAPSTLGTST